MFEVEKDNSKVRVEKIWLSSPTMHGPELTYMEEAYDSNWMSTVGANIDEVEKAIAEKVGVGHAVALSSGTAALHLAMKIARVKRGTKVACSDMTFNATVNPIVYEGGNPIFIDSEYDTWNMDPLALEKAFELYPKIKVVVLVHLYGTPAKIDEIKEICDKHEAILIEDAAESLGSSYKGACSEGEWRQTGTFGDMACISTNGNKIITGSSGGFYLTDSLEEAEKVRKWSTQSREEAIWYQHKEIGYNYRMSNVIAGVVRGQVPYLEEHIEQKKAIYERYREGFKDLPVKMNPIDFEKSKPNYWLSSLLIDEDAMSMQIISEEEAIYASEAGKSCPMDILSSLERYKIEGRPIWKPMHMQPFYKKRGYVTRKGDGRIARIDVGRDIFYRGLCLPSDIKMTEGQQEFVIEVVSRCFD